MKKGRIWRNLGSLIMGIFITIILIEFHITPKKICNYTDVISGVLSMTSISTSFIFASFSRRNIGIFIIGRIQSI